MSRYLSQSYVRRLQFGRFLRLVIEFVQRFLQIVENGLMFQRCRFFVGNAKVPAAEYFVRQNVVNTAAGFDETTSIRTGHAETRTSINLGNVLNGVKMCKSVTQRI